MEIRLSKPPFSKSSKQLLTGILAFGFLLSSFQPTSAATFTENFDNTIYKDSSTTTADWNITDGVLKLAKEGGGVAGSRLFPRVTTKDGYTYVAYYEQEDCVRVAKLRPNGTPVDGTDPSDPEGASFGTGGVSVCVDATVTTAAYDIVAPVTGGVYILYQGKEGGTLQRLDAVMGHRWWNGRVGFPNDPTDLPFYLLDSQGESWTMATDSAGYVYIGAAKGGDYYLLRLDNDGAQTIKNERVVLPGTAPTYRDVDLAVSGNYLYLGWESGSSCFVRKYRNNLTDEWATPLEIANCSGYLSIQAESGGNFYLLSSQGSALVVRKYDSSKNLLWGPTQFSSNGLWNELGYNTNQLYATWMDLVGGTTTHRMQRFDINNGNKLFGANGLALKTPWVGVGYLNNYGPVVTVDSGGNAISAYTCSSGGFIVEVVKIASDQSEVFRVVPPPKPTIYLSSGRGQSTTVASTTGNILSATLTATQTLNGGSISYYLSANGGTNWEGPVTPGSAWTFANQGKNLRWRADLSTPDTTKTPWVDSLNIDYQEALPCLERSPSTLTFTATAGGSNPAAQNINISNSGGGTLSWASSDDQTWITAVGASPGSTVNVSINISGLAAGTYNGTVTMSCSPLSSCQAGACQQKTTSVTLTVNPAPVPAISRSPTSLTFTAITQGQSSTESKTFEVWNSGGSGSTLNWSLSESASWFGVSPASGSSTGEHDTVTVTLVNTSSLTAGTYTETITISDPNASNTPQTVNVSLTVNALPCLERAPSSLTFTATAGGSNPAAQNINISNSGGGTLSWASSDDQTWITAVGASPGSTVNVSINISGLAAGTYNGTVTMSCSPLSSCQAGACQQKTTSVTLTVNPAPVPAISRSPTSLTFTPICEGATSSESKTFEVWNSGDSGTTLNWSLSESASWFGVSPGSGSSTGEHDVVTVTLVNTSSLAAGTYTSNITISDPNASNSPQTVSVSLTVNTKPCLERSPSSLTFSATAGGSNPSSQNINISNSGVCSLSWASSDNQTWISTTDASLTATVSINISGLTAATYTGTVTLSCNPLSSCQSGSCQQKTTSVTLTVNPAPVPAISRSPTSLTFTPICEGATSTESRTFEVWNSGDSGTTLNWSLSESASWFGVSPGSGNSTGEHDVVTVTLVNTSSLAAGTYTSNITISDPNASNTPQTVPVSLTVNSKPCLESAVRVANRCPSDPTNPYKMCFIATAGGSDPTPGTIDVNNSGVCSLSWQSSDNQTWITTTDASSTATVSINTSGLTAGTYTGTVTLSCNPLSSCQAGACQQKTTSVTLTVNEAIGTISGCVWRDTNSVCPADGTPDANRGNAVEISATGYSTQTAGTDAAGCYAFNSVPYNPSGTVYRVEVKKPAGEEDEWSYACAGGFDGQGFRNVTLETGVSNWTVGFSIVNTRPGWFQVIDGDIHCEGEIEDNVP